MMKFFKQKNTLPSKKSNLTSSAGFTLLEAIIAIGIFTGSVLGMIVILGNGIASNNSARQKIVATYLAEEGIEYMRNIRDTYALYSVYNTPSTNGWADFKDKVLPCDTASNGGKACYFDYKTDASGISGYNMFTTTDPQPITKIYLGTCSTNGCPELRYQLEGSSSKGEYNYESGVDSEGSGFIRQINIRYLPDIATANEVQVISTVYWGQGLNAKRISFSDYLFNWVK